MRLHRTLISAGLILSALALSGLPASASSRNRVYGNDRDRGYRDRGAALAVDLELATAYLHDAADRDLRLRGRYGHTVAGTLHRMDEWANYYRKAVERDGFRSAKARQRFDRFLVEYRSACAFLDGRRGPEIATLHSTVAQLSGAYGRHMAWQGAWDDERWEGGRDGGW